MKKLTHLTCIVATSLLAVSTTTSAFSAEADQVVVRTVYGTEVTQAIAKSVGLLKRISEGDRFAVLQSANGAWALALLPAGMNPGKLDLIELPQTGQAQSNSTDHVKWVKLLAPAHGAEAFGTQLAGSQP
jgi:ABC-type molybdate transport system substrate-binding protein